MARTRLKRDAEVVADIGLDDVIRMDDVSLGISVRVGDAASPEQKTIKKDLRIKLALMLSDQAIDLAWELLEEPDHINDFLLDCKKRGWVDSCSIYKAKSRPGGRGYSRRILVAYLRERKGLKNTKAKTVVAELLCWATAVVYSE